VIATLTTGSEPAADLGKSFNAIAMSFFRPVSPA